HREPAEPTTDTVAHASPAPVAVDVAADGPVHRLKGVLGPTVAADPPPLPASIGSASDPDLEAREIILASAIYVTGTRGLQAGSRYGIALIGTNLGILGPVDIDPTAIVALRPLHGLDATGAQGQLIITSDEGFLNRFAMVFMALAGGTPERGGVPRSSPRSWPCRSSSPPPWPSCCFADPASRRWSPRPPPSRRRPRPR